MILPLTKISNPTGIDPALGVTRWVVPNIPDDKSILNPDDKRLVVVYHIKFFDANNNDITFTNYLYTRPPVVRTADNTTPVDIKGAYVLDLNGNPDWSNPSVVSGEYDFIKNAIANGVDIKDLLIGAIVKIDAIGGFDK